MDKIKFAQRLEEARKAKKLSQEELGKLLGLSRFPIIDWEAGRKSPDLFMASKIADCLDVSFDYLMGTSDDLKEGSKHPNLYEMLADGILHPVREKSKLAFNQFLDENPDIEAWFRRTRRGDFEDTFSEEEAQVLRDLIIQQLKKWDEEDRKNEENFTPRS